MRRQRSSSLVLGFLNPNTLCRITNFTSIHPEKRWEWLHNPLLLSVSLSKEGTPNSEPNQRTRVGVCPPSTLVWLLWYEWLALERLQLSLGEWDAKRGGALWESARHQKNSLWNGGRFSLCHDDRHSPKLKGGLDTTEPAGPSENTPSLWDTRWLLLASNSKAEDAHNSHPPIPTPHSLPHQHKLETSALLPLPHSSTFWFITPL